MEIVIRQATMADRESLWDFVKMSYGEEFPELGSLNYPVYWNWQFTDNPFVTKADGRLPIWIACAGNEIVGQIGSLPMTLHAGVETYNGGWGIDLIVNKKFRGFGLGRRLLKACSDYFQISVHVTMAQSTHKIWDKFGSVPVNPVSVMWKPLLVEGDFIYRIIMRKTSTRPLLRKVTNLLCRYFFLHNVVTFVSNTMVRLLGGFKSSRRNDSKVEIAELLCFDIEFGEFIKRASLGYDVIVHRTVKFLSWKYMKNPTVKYRIFAARKEGTLTGYIVLRTPHPTELRIGIISDLFTASGDTESIEALVRHAITYFGKNVNVIESLVSHLFIKKTMKMLGFFTIRNYIPHFLCMQPTLRMQMMDHRSDWFLTYADHDLDQIHPIGF